MSIKLIDQVTLLLTGLHGPRAEMLTGLMAAQGDATNTHCLKHNEGEEVSL